MKLNKLMNDYKKLCPASKFYFVVSMFSLVFVALSNFGKNDNKFCVGNYGCKMSRSSSLIIFVINALLIVFHSWVLDLICNAGYKNLSWALVLMPFIIFLSMFVLLISNDVLKKLR